MPRRRVTGAAVVAAAALLALAIPASGGAQSTTARPFPAPEGGCYTGAGPTAMAPNQVRALYDLTPLWEAGHRGQGKRIAIVDLGQQPDRTEFDTFSHCFGIDTPLHVQVVGDGATPPVGGEASLDVQLPLIAAPELEAVYVFATTPGLHDAQLRALEAALDPANTGGEPIDAVSTSFSLCEPSLIAGTAPSVGPDYVDDMSALLEQAAARGITVFADAADGGSSACAHWPVAESNPQNAVAAAAFPASSPWVVAVGGTQFDVTKQPDGSGEVTTELVWNELSAKSPTDRIAGGGEQSQIFDAPPWQQGVVPGTARGVPDVAALAGTPYYSWSDDASFWDGTSAATPFTAGGWLAVLTALEAHGIANPGFLAPILYDLHATDAEAVFRDITVGNNDVWGRVGCCAAGPGYDLASGLGSLRFAGLARALGAQVPPTTTSTTTSTAGAAVPVTPQFTG